MGDKQDKYSIKLPGKSLLIFVLVASCVFVVYYFANMITDLQNDTNKKSDLVWLQKILNDRKRPQNQHRPVGYKSRFDDYHDERNHWDATSDYTDYLDDKVVPERNFGPFRKYGKQHRQGPFRKQSDETKEKSNSQALNDNSRKWIHPALRSHWYLDDSSVQKSSPSADRSKSAYFSGTPRETSKDNFNWQEEDFRSGSTSYDSTTTKYSTTQETLSMLSKISSEVHISEYEVSSTLEPGIKIIKNRETTPNSAGAEPSVKNWLLRKNKLGNHRTTSKDGLYDLSNSEFSKSGVSAVSPSSKVQIMGPKASFSINGNEVREKGISINDPMHPTNSSKVLQLYKQKWSVDQHAIKSPENKSLSQQEIMDSMPSHEQHNKTGFDSTQVQNLQKFGTIGKSKDPSTLSGTLSNYSKSLILTSVLKKQETPIYLNDDKKFDEVAETKKNIIFPKYINVIDWSSEHSFNVKPECVPMSTLSSYVRICIHPFEEDQDISARIRGHMGYEFDAMRDVQLATLQDKNIGLIDVGAGLGEYSLAMAPLKRYVVAVEPYSPHVQLFQRSVRLNKFEEYITLIKNVISDKNDEYSMRHNPGHINDVIFSTNGQIPSNDSARSITLDQLSTVIPFKKAVLKIDVPNFTKEALTESNELFNNVDIKYVFTHWNSSDLALNKFLVGFFQRMGYHASIQLNGARLRWENYKTWPYSSIIWQKTI